MPLDAPVMMMVLLAICICAARQHSCGAKSCHRDASATLGGRGTIRAADIQELADVIEKFLAARQLGSYALYLQDFGGPADSDAKLAMFFERPITEAQYFVGEPDPSLVSPDAIEHAQWGMDRPGNKAIQLELHADYGSNVARYDEWHQYLREQQPRTLIMWGQNRRILQLENNRHDGQRHCVR